MARLTTRSTQCWHSAVTFNLLKVISISCGNRVPIEITANQAVNLTSV